MNKYKDEVVDDIEEFISNRFAYYAILKKKILEWHKTDKWKLLPEMAIREYIEYDAIQDELNQLAREVRRIAINNIADEKEQISEWNTQACIDAGR